MAKKKKTSTPAVPDIFSKQKETLRRTHRQVIYLNDSELAVVEEYCRRYKMKSHSTIFREAAIERILQQLDDSHPTLF